MSAFAMLSPSTVRPMVLAALAVCSAAVPCLGQQPVVGPTPPPPPDRYLGRGNYIFSAGIRSVQGIDVTLGGMVDATPFTRDVPPLEGEANRIYEDGFVLIDADDATPAGTTNSWNLQSLDQVVDGQFEYHLYSIAGSTPFTGEGDSSAIAVDLQLGRILARPASRVVLALTGGFTAGPIDSDGATENTVDLRTLADRFDSRGFTPPNAPFTPTESTDDEGNIIPKPAIGSTIVSRTETIQSGAGQLATNWEVKGGFYNFRLGPTVYIQLTRLLSLQLGAGASVYYAATDFTFEDTLTTPTSTQTSEATSSGEDWLTGYYADASLQFWLSDRAGLFVGGTMQKSDKYRQSADSRFAEIDFSRTTQISFGLNYQF